MMQIIIDFVINIIISVCIVKTIYYIKDRKDRKQNQLEEGELKTQLKFTIKSVIRWEQINNKPFAKLDYDNEEDLISLLYVCQNNKPDSTLNEFKDSLSKNLITQMIREFEKQTALIAQFQKKNISINTASTKNTNTDSVYIKNLVPILIMNGLDAHYAMNEMELCDLNLYLEAHDRNIKDKLEYDRLWTFILLSPHLSKNTRLPKDLYPFPWEIKDDIHQSELDKQESIEILKSSLKYGLN